MKNFPRGLAFAALAFCVLVLGACRDVAHGSASTVEYDFRCEPVADDPNAVSIVDFNPSNELLDLVVPSELRGKKVVAIGEKAFAYCESLSSISFPDGVTTIGASAFLGVPKTCVFSVFVGSYASRWARENGFRVETREE